MGAQSIHTLGLSTRHPKGAVGLCAMVVSGSMLITHLLILLQIEQALTLWSTSTVTAPSIETKLPVFMKTVNLNNQFELMKSTLFDEATWGAAMTSYITSCDKVTPEGWMAIKNEALVFAKVNSHRNVSVLLDNIGTSTQNNDNHGNLFEDSDDTEEEGGAGGIMQREESPSDPGMEAVPHNGIRGITQGDESSSDLGMESVPNNGVWGITQGDESPSDSGMELVPNNGVQGITQGDESPSDLGMESVPNNGVRGITQGDESPSNSEEGSVMSCDDE